MPDPPQDDDRQKGNRGKPRDAWLAERHHDQCSQQRPHRGPEIAADLKHRLCEAEAPARSEPRDPRQLRMKHRRSKPDQGRRDQNDRILLRDAEQQQTEEGKSHADGERERLRLFVGEMSDQWLQQRGGELERQRDQADLGEVERIAFLQDRIDRRNQRLHGVIEEVREADAAQRDVGRSGHRLRAGDGIGSHVRHHHRREQCFFGDDNRLVQGGIPSGIRGGRTRVTYDGRAAPTSINR